MRNPGLIDINGNKMQLPSNFDAGILGLPFSPSGKHLIVWSSYDRMDYDKYSRYRAEIIAYYILDAKGFKAIKPDFNYYSKSWSIEKLIWINEHSIALKIYYEDRVGDGSKLNYNYVKTKIE